jgi:surface antigen
LKLKRRAVLFITGVILVGGLVFAAGVGIAGNAPNDDPQPPAQNTSPNDPSFIDSDGTDSTGAGAVPGAATSDASSASTGGYPWWNSRCVATGKATGSCPGNDWGCVTSAAHPTGMCYRNCTDWVAWKLGLKWAKPFTGNALGWKAIADQPHNGWVSVTHAQINDIAWFSYGHVALVTKVNSNGTVNVSEYNNPSNYGLYHTRSNVTRGWYLHRSSSG